MIILEKHGYTIEKLGSLYYVNDNAGQTYGRKATEAAARRLFKNVLECAGSSDKPAPVEEEKIIEVGEEVVFEEKVRATILLENTWGLPISRHISISKIKIEKRTGGVGNWVACWYTIRGERQRRAIRFGKCVIGKGWQDISGTFNSDPCSVNGFLVGDDEQFESLASQLTGVFVRNMKCY